jgi:predicted phosphodiesterase
MRYGIISDIHGNLEALQAVLKVLKKASVDKVICAGDIVGYGPNPQQCIDALVYLNIKAVAGNHDWAMIGRLDASYFTNDGKSAIMLTRPMISMKGFDYLTGLKLIYRNKDLLCVHASLDHPKEFNYLYTWEDALPTLALMDRPVCFVGHTHLPVAFIQDHDSVWICDESSLSIQQDNKYVINVGSVGQPRDGNIHACCCIYDTLDRTVEFKRVPYDYGKTVKRMNKIGLPASLSERLSLGE